MFVKPYVFDDVYMGILAKKLAIEPFHCAQFWFHRKYPYKIKDFVYTVASHEFSNPTELERVWNEQKQAGNAWHDQAEFNHTQHKRGNWSFEKTLCADTNDTSVQFTYL